MKGQSGNPSGRPKGIPNPTAQLRRMIDAVAIVKRLERSALEGDVQAARTLLERVLPPLRSTTEPVILPGHPFEADLTAQARAVLLAVSQGKLAPDLGSQLVAAIGSVARVSEVDELLRRLKILEDDYAKDRKPQNC